MQTYTTTMLIKTLSDYNAKFLILESLSTTKAKTDIGTQYYHNTCY